jgi:hypothetical protein
MPILRRNGVTRRLGGLGPTAPPSDGRAHGSRDHALCCGIPPGFDAPDVIPEDLVAADSLVTGVVRQRYLSIEEVVQLPPPDVIHLMFVIVRTVTKRTVVVLEPYGSFGTGVVHGVGIVVVVLAGHVSTSVVLRYRRF